MTDFSDGTERRFGYLYGPDQGEDFQHLEEIGLTPVQTLALCAASYPQHDPFAPPLNTLMYQGPLGSCAGHAGAQSLQICYGMATGQWLIFSRGGCYIMAQDIDGIRGDRGSTVAAVAKVLEGGLCLESEWEYSTNYNQLRRNKPTGEVFQYSVSRSQRITKDNGGADLAWDLLEKGAVLQTGYNHNSSFDREVVDDVSNARGGGHSTILKGLIKRGGDIDARQDNSWKNWMRDGRNQWSKRAVDKLFRIDRWFVLVAYSHDNTKGPADTKPISMV